MYIFYVFFLQSPERSGENMLFAKKERVPLCSDDASLLFVWRVLIFKNKSFNTNYHKTSVQPSINSFSISDICFPSNLRFNLESNGLTKCIFFYQSELVEYNTSLYKVKGIQLFSNEGAGPLKTGDNLVLL